MLTRRHAIAALAGFAPALVGLSAEAARLHARYGFNDAEIDWMLLREGLEEARQANRPVLLLLHAKWCPSCRAYRKLFFDAEVVALVNRFTPVLVEANREPRVNGYYARDGGYVPRTMVLAPDGELMAGVTGPRDTMRYYIPHSDQQALVRFLHRGLEATGADGPRNG